MEISIWSLLGGLSGFVVLVIQVGKLLGWWASAGVDGKITNPEDQFPLVAAALRSLQDGKITPEEFAQLVAMLGTFKAAKE